MYLVRLDGHEPKLDFDPLHKTSLAHCGFQVANVICHQIVSLCVTELCIIFL